MRSRLLIGLVTALAWSQSSAIHAQEGTRPEDPAIRHQQQLEEMIQKLEDHGQKEQANRLREQLERMRRGAAEARERMARERDERSEAERAEREEQAERLREQYGRERRAQAEERERDERMEREHHERDHAEQHEREERKRHEEMDQRIHHLRAAAENLHAIGEHGPAEELMMQAEQIERELRGHHPPEHHAHMEAMEHIEAMKRELHAVREELTALRAEVRMLRETLLRLPPPAMERRLNPPSLPPAPERRPAPVPERGEFPRQVPRRPSDGSAGLFHSLDHNKDNLVSAVELGPLKNAWEAAGIDIPLDEPLTPEQFADRMEAFLNTRAQRGNSTTTTNHPAGHVVAMEPATGHLDSLVAESLFRNLDRDLDDKISPSEWEQSRTLKPRFENAHIDLSEAMSRDAFLKHYLELDKNPPGEVADQQDEPVN